MKEFSNIASFEMSKLLGETPYVKEAVRFYYNTSGRRCTDPSGMLTINAKYPAPSLGEILDWLRINYEQVVTVTPNNETYYKLAIAGERTPQPWSWRKYVNCLAEDRKEVDFIVSDEDFKLYIDALIAGITDALEKLKE